MTTKNFGIAAVGGDLQYGKKGGRIVFDSENSLFKITGADGATVSRVKVADAQELDDAISLSQLNSVESALQGQIDTVEASAGLETDGSLVITGTNYVDAANTLKEIGTLLDAQVKANADAILAADGEIGELTSLSTDEKGTIVGAINEVDGNVDALQIEVDATQTGAGLGTDGSYTTDDTTNYLKAADFAAADGGNGIAESLFNADVLLDAQIRQVADDLAALGTGSITDIQNELDTTQAGAGLTVDGDYQAPSAGTTNYISGASNINDATGLLDQQVKANADKIGSAALTVGTDLSNAVNVLDSEIGDLNTLDAEITNNGTLVGAINELQSDITGLGTMASQDADAVAITGGTIDAVAITGGTIDGVVIGGTTAANGTFADVTVNGNLTVLGETTTLDVTNLAVEDNTIILNNGETGQGVTNNTSGIEIDRGTEQNARWVWDDTTDSWAAQVFDGSTWQTASITGNFSGSAVDFGFASTSLVRGDSTEFAMGTENQVLKVGASDIEYGYVEDIRSSAGDVVFGQAELGVNGTGGEYLEFASEDNEVYLTARNSAGTGDVDLYLSGQGNGDVIISQNASQQGLIIAEDDTTLTVSGGNSAAADAGDAILKGGDGSTGFASGDVILQGGTGGNAEGITIIKDSAGNEVSSFTGVASATDYVNVENGIGEATISAVGDSTDVDLVLAPKGTGAVLVPAGYDISSAADEAVVNKGYVDSQITEVASNVDPLIMRASVGTGSSSVTIGTMSNIAGKTYYVSRITLHVTADFDVDHMVVTDGTTQLAEEADSDVLAGTYVVDLPFAVATAGGADIDVEFKDGSEAAAIPTAGSMIAVVEYKVL